MKSGTAAYWMPVTVQNIQYPASKYTGYQSKDHEDLDRWLTEGLSWFSDIYGTVVDVHYVTEEVISNTDGNYEFVTMIVVTAIVDSGGDFNEVTHNDWPADLIEQLAQATERVNMDGIAGYDLNPIRPDPVWSKFNR